MKGGLDERAGKAYQRALEAVLAIPIGIGIGYFVDVRLESSPIGLGIGAALGFAAFVRRLVSMRSLMESAPPPSEGDGSKGDRSSNETEAK